MVGPFEIDISVLMSTLITLIGINEHLYINMRTQNVVVLF